MYLSGCGFRSVRLEADHHRVRPQATARACGYETGVAHPGLAVGAVVVEPTEGLDQHVQAHQQAEGVAAALVVDDGVIDDQCPAVRQFRNLTNTI